MNELRFNGKDFRNLDTAQGLAVYFCALRGGKHVEAKDTANACSRLGLSAAPLCRSQIEKAHIEALQESIIVKRGHLNYQGERFLNKERIVKDLFSHRHMQKMRDWSPVIDSTIIEWVGKMIDNNDANIREVVEDEFRSLSGSSDNEIEKGAVDHINQWIGKKVTDRGPIQNIREYTIGQIDDHTDILQYLNSEAAQYALAYYDHVSAGILPGERLKEPLKVFLRFLYALAIDAAEVDRTIDEAEALISEKRGGEAKKILQSVIDETDSLFFLEEILDKLSYSALGRDGSEINEEAMKIIGGLTFRGNPVRAVVIGRNMMRAIEDVYDLPVNCQLISTLRHLVHNRMHTRQSSILICIVDTPSGKLVTVIDKGPGMKDVIKAVSPGATTRDLSQEEIESGKYRMEDPQSSRGGMGLVRVMEDLALLGGHMTVESSGKGLEINTVNGKRSVFESPVDKGTKITIRTPSSGN